LAYGSDRALDLLAAGRIKLANLLAPTQPGGVGWRQQLERIFNPQRLRGVDRPAPANLKSSRAKRPFRGRSWTIPTVPLQPTRPVSGANFPLNGHKDRGSPPLGSPTIQDESPDGFDHSARFVTASTSSTTSVATGLAFNTIEGDDFKVSRPYQFRTLKSSI
jgi:hypothetical protein